MALVDPWIYRLFGFVESLGRGLAMGQLLIRGGGLVVHLSLSCLGTGMGEERKKK